ncbi:periodic tryptophan protein 2 [Paragonimus westermani]|uniref:Periodic tryptophan protein 2 n=1 Tax=Paragonimus westermani TaxID=34504 RepID=A0A5J4P2S1_9TREM|nr:periodic tryptophan protein 2 [Paragonimus westermani]
MLFFVPGARRQLNHLELYRVYYGFNDDVVSLDWSSDSSLFLAGSMDSTCRVFSVHRLKRLIVYTLSGHRNPVVGGFFFKGSMNLTTVSCDGDVCVWETDETLGKLRSDDEDIEKVLFRLGKRLFNYPISTLTVNSSGDWIGAGCEVHGQLTVWEWRTQVCYLKAESHAGQMTNLAYSPDGLHLVTGGHDKKVKVWRISSGRALVTFSEHQAAVTGVAFPQLKAKVVLSSSLDGTIRVYDLVRYRNFRTLTVPTRLVQFASLAVDAPGSLVAGGSLDTFEAFIWSVKTGVLLATLAGHTAPISALAFSPDIGGSGIELASVSWDDTLRLWDLTGNSADMHNPSSMGSVKEVVHFSHDVLSVAYRGDGKEIALCLLTGDIVFYDPSEGIEKGTISGKRDLGLAQTSEDDLITPKRAGQARKFQTIAYSTDGEHLLAAGDSKYICLYSVPDRVLLKRFEITCNMSLDGVQEVHDRRRFLAHFSAESMQAKASQRCSLPIPQTRAGVDRSRREWRPEIHVSSVQFSPTGDAFAATTTEGVVVYSLASAGSGFGLGSHFGQEAQSSWLFDAVGVDEEATPANARLALAEGQQAKALDIAIRLRLQDLVEEIMEAIPADQIDFLARQIPTKQVADYVIPFLARQLGGRSRHVEFYVHWTESILRAHGLKLRRDAATLSLVATANTAPHAQNARDTEGNTVEDKMAVSSPGFLTERGEWAACQASLVRLQTSLEKIKTHVIQSSYRLSAIAMVTRIQASLKSCGVVNKRFADIVTHVLLSLLSLVFVCIVDYDPICVVPNLPLKQHSSLCGRFEAVDNLWNYLDSVAQLKAAEQPTDAASLSNTLLPSDSLDDPSIPAGLISQPIKRASNSTRGKKKLVRRTTLTA